MTDVVPLRAYLDEPYAIRRWRYTPAVLESGGEQLSAVGGGGAPGDVQQREPAACARECSPLTQGGIGGAQRGS